MKKTILIIVVLHFSIFSFGQTVGKYTSADQAKLQSLPVRWEHYWNIHDMDSMGTLLHDNVDFVNVAGIWMKGKAETIADHKQKHLGIVFKSSTWTTDSVDIKYLKPDLAIMHLSWGLSGDYDPDGTPRKPRHGIFTWVVVKEHEHWAILIAQNTNKR